ncbi:hypothetical protein K2Z84_05210 [Candidatus Binatia bacterium]|nr:hypothetical protein [Candidatus Binatia bacterium]
MLAIERGKSRALEPILVQAHVDTLTAEGEAVRLREELDEARDQADELVAEVRLGRERIEHQSTLITQLVEALSIATEALEKSRDVATKDVPGGTVAGA